LMAPAVRTPVGDLPHHLHLILMKHQELSKGSGDQGHLTMGTQSGNCVIMGFHAVKDTEDIN
jgi:hypothetical protein